MLHVNELSKEYPTPRGPLRVLSGVSFDLKPGDAAAIMGPSGSGKSSLLYILGGLEPPTSGTVTLDGKNPFQLDATGLAATNLRTAVDRIAGYAAIGRNEAELVIGTTNANLTVPNSDPDLQLDLAATRKPEPTQVTVYVRDNGIGIDPKYHQKIFRIFCRLVRREESFGPHDSTSNYAYDYRYDCR